MGSTTNYRVEGDVYHRNPAGSGEAGHPPERVEPQFGHRIEIEAREGVFIVLRTDVERRTVDVLRISGMRQIEAGIPMTLVHILHGQNSGDLFENIDG